MPKLFGRRWQFVRDLGAGGQARVALVQDTTGEFQGDYALKRLSGEPPLQARSRFEREISALRRVAHDGVMRVVDQTPPGGKDGEHYYVMTYTAGMKPLSKIIGTQENPYAGDLGGTMDFARQLLSALAACHEAGVVHRDLSPGNVLLNVDSGRVLVIDFGITQIIGHAPVTLVDEAVGTPNYMAPECESGAEASIDRRADIYSTGKIIWSLVTNRKAFSREQRVFAELSMATMFPQNDRLWHLHHVFERSIRGAPGDRAESADRLAEVCDLAKQLAESNVLPLEKLVAGACGICRYGRVGSFDGGHVVFGNPNPRGIKATRCNYCGYCAAVDYESARARLEARSALR